MKAGLAGAAIAAGAALSAGAAHAQVAEEVRVGVLAHNIKVIDPKNANKEDGVDIQLGAVFGSGFMHGSGLHPYVLATINTAGDTSYAAAGLEWQWRFARGWRFTPAFGLAVHDGELGIPYPPGDPRNTEFDREHVLLGSRVLFHSQLGVERDLGEHLGVQVVYEHLSNGQILHHGRNQGLDEAGVRLAYRFGK